MMDTNATRRTPWRSMIVPAPDKQRPVRGSAMSEAAAAVADHPNCFTSTRKNKLETGVYAGTPHASPSVAAKKSRQPAADSGVKVAAMNVILTQPNTRSPHMMGTAIAAESMGGSPYRYPYPRVLT